MTEGLQPEHRSRVLILDDDESQLDTLSSILQDQGFEVVGCQTAEAGLQRLERGDIDVAIVEPRLSHVDETQLLDSLAELAEDVASIIHTGHGSYQSVWKAIDIGSFGFVEKGSNPEEIVRQVHRAIQDRLQRRAEKLEAVVRERTKALSESEARSAEAQRIAHIGYWEVDLTSGEIKWSDELYRIMQVDPDAQLDLDTAMREFTHPDDRAMAQKAVEDALATGELSPFEFRCVTRKGEERVLWSKGKVITNDRGEPVRFVGVNQDITERKRAENTLRKSEERFRLIAEMSAEDIWQLDLNGQVTYVSPAVQRVFGYTPQEAMGLGFHAFLDDTEMERANQAFARAASGQEYQLLELEGKKRDGCIVPIEVSITPIICDDTIVGVQGIARDITERKQTVEELRRREAFERIVAQVSSALVDVGKLDEGINHALDAIGRFCTVDRAYVFLIRADGRTIDNTHEWCAEGIEPRIGNLQGIVVADELPWFWRHMQDRKTFHVTAVRDLPPEACLEKKHFEAQDIQALIVVPMVCDDVLIGFLGFDCVRGEKTWSEDQAGLLRIAADTVARAVVRRRVEEALAESEGEFRSFVENANDIVYSLSLEGKFTYISPNARELLGRDTSEFLGRHFADFIHPDDLPRCNEFFQNVISTGEKASGIEYRARHQDGSWRWHISNASPRKDESRRVVAFVGISRDVTAQRLAEERLRLLSTVADQVSDSIIATDTDFRITFVNKAAVRLFGYELAELAGQRPDFLNVEPMSERIQEEVYQTVAARRTYAGTHRNRRKDGSTFICDLRVAPLMDENGEICGYVGLQRDVTERTRAREALRESEQKLRSIIEHSNEVFFVHDVDNTLSYVSPQCEPVLGYTPAEMQRNWTELLTNNPLNEEGVERTQAAIRTGCRQPSYVLEIRRKDGRLRLIEIDESPIKDDCGNVVCISGAVRDVTEQKQMEEQLRHTQKMEAVGQLAAGVAHEFNNLLFGILGTTELILATQDGTIPERFDRHLRDIKKCGQRGAALTKQLLAFARKKAPEISRFDISQVVGELASMLRQVGDETITLEMDLASDLPPVEADRAQVEQSIMNLARNACDAMPDGGILTIRSAAAQLDDTRVSRMPHARPGAYVQLSVADTGCGMAPETMERVFEPFFTTKPVGEGTGLGLSTVFADVTRSGGLVEVESRLGEGTVFRVYLPAVEKQDLPTSCDTERSKDPCPGGSETILVCDDDEVVLDSAAFLLETRGYSVIRAGGGRAALEVAESHAGTIELLLTDVTMPQMNGWELAQELTAQRPDLKVIYMSGYAEDVLAAGAAEGEHIEFLQKPPAADALFRRIREVLDATTRPAP